MRTDGAVWAALAIFCFLLQSPADAQEWSRSPRQVQQALVNFGFKLGAVDGVWGKKSSSALRAFQKAHGLNETGVLDEATSAKLFAPSKKLADDIVKELSTPAPAAIVEPTGTPKSDSSWGTGSNALRSDPPVVRAPLPPASPPSELGKPSNSISEGKSPSIDGAVELPSAGKADPIGVPSQSRNSPQRADAPGTLPLRLTSPSSSTEVGRQTPNGSAVARTNTASDTRPASSSVTPSQYPPLPQQSDSSSESRFSGYIVLGVVGFMLFRFLSRKKPSPVSAQPPRPASVNAASRVRPSSPAVLKTASSASYVPPASQWKPTPNSKPAASSAPSTKWIPAGTEVRVGNHVIRGGMVYVGGFLPKKGALHENENCLINPLLPIGSRGDPAGVTMGYWPAYGHITPEARKSYLEWLAGDRSDPSTYIGYVFLYFYGLERRLLLDTDATDIAEVLSEVRRLLSVYGESGSFRRYATKLISACELKTMSYAPGYDFGTDSNSYEVPIAVRVALGQCLAEGNLVESDLLFAYVMSHPETQVRTPAKRVERSLLKQVFADELGKRFPKGIRISGKSGRKLRLDYHSCSGTFDLEIKPFGLDLVDVTDRKQPISDARVVFDACVEKLEAYSRALGKANGLRPTLASIAKLPAPYRLQEACRLTDQPLVRLYEWSNEGRPVRIEDLAALAGMPKDKPITRAFVSDLSGTLVGVGFGHTGDPDYATRSPKAGDTVVVFPVTNTTSVPPSPRYRPTQLMVLLGLLMAFADGEVQPQELWEINARIDAEPDLSDDERQRLKAELTASLDNPKRLDDFAKKLKDADPASHAHIADTLVAMATADGTVHPEEVRQLERLFRLMSLDTASLYGRLHDGAAANRGRVVQTCDDEAPEIIPPDQAYVTVPIPPPPLPGPTATVRVDTSRLEAIREESRKARELLSTIFADDAEQALEPPPIEPEETETSGDLFEGLERRYGALLLELRVRGQWATDEFARLAREAGLMPAAVINVLNDWAFDIFDEPLLEGDDPITINLQLLPLPTGSGSESDERVTS